MPMLCFAFFFENILIPVSKAFTLKDDNGSMGMKSSIISLLDSFGFYAMIIILITVIKVNYQDTQNHELYIAVF